MCYSLKSMTHDQKILKKLYFLLLLVSLLQKESSFAEMTIFAKFVHAMRSNSAALLVANCCLVFVSPKKIMPNMQENR